MPASQPTSSSRRFLPAVVLLAVAALLWIFRSRIHFDFHAVLQQLRTVSLGFVLAAIASLYSGYIFRALRWRILLDPIRPATTLELLPAQFIGFAMVGLIGRVADLSRPYLIARRLSTPVATQLAIYSIERAFDLAAAAILFSITLAFAPASMPHHEAFARAGILSLAATLGLAAFAVSVRITGDRIASLATKLLHPLSPRFGETVAARLLDFRHGLQAITTLRELLYALACSLVIWVGIAATYLFSARAFIASPELATFSIAATMLLLATSMGGSLVQLPVLGWFTQIAVLAAALHGFFSVPLEAATACGTVLQFITNFSVVPAGLIAAQIQGVSLKEAATTPST
ncbi:MAG: lysylphosphatidylglycerol synthase transmembrane domain-containing protein [Acidobacteriota bacterium]